MNADRWEAAKSIFDAALSLPHADREAYLGRACGDDTELEEQVRALLLGHDDAGDFLASPTSNEILGIVTSTKPADSSTLPAIPSPDEGRRLPLVAVGLGALAVAAVVITVLVLRHDDAGSAASPIVTAPVPAPPDASDVANDPDDRHALASARMTRGRHAAAEGQWTEAHAAYEAALVELSALVAKSPRVPRYRMSLALQHQELALLHARQGQWAEAIEQHDTALAVRSRLADDPDDPDGIALLWALQRDVALARVGRGDEALEHAAAATAGDGIPPSILRAAADVFAAAGDDPRAAELRRRAGADP